MSRTPATTLHDVVVIHEQTREEWCAGRGAIEGGRLIVACARNHSAPAFVRGGTSTYTITAADGGNRQRRFPNLTFDPAASRPPKRYVFT